MARRLRIVLALFLASGAAACSVATDDKGLWLGQLIRTCTLNPLAAGLHYHHAPLGVAARLLGAVTTPFKYLGIYGWTDIGLRAEVVGRVYQDSAWSTDGFTTVDIEIHRLEIFLADGGCRYERQPGDPDTFIRIEIKPWVQSPAMAGIKQDSLVRVSGRLKVDHDDDFFEIHPELGADIVRLGGD